MNYITISKPFKSQISDITYVVSLVNIQIRIHVSLVRTPNGPSHARPWLLECKDTFDVVSVNFFAGHGVDDCGLDAEEGQRGGAGFGGCYACEGGDDVGSCLGLPVRLLFVSIEISLGS